MERRHDRDTFGRPNDPIDRPTSGRGSHPVGHRAKLTSGGGEASFHVPMSWRALARWLLFFQLFALVGIATPSRTIPRSEQAVDVVLARAQIARPSQPQVESTKPRSHADAATLPPSAPIVSPAALAGAIAIDPIPSSPPVLLATPRARGPPADLV